ASPAGPTRSENVPPCGSFVCTVAWSALPLRVTDEAVVAWTHPAAVRSDSEDGPAGPASVVDERTGLPSTENANANGAVSTSIRSDPLRTLSARAGIEARRTTRTTAPARIIPETVPVEWHSCRS